MIIESAKKDNLNEIVSFSNCFDWSEHQFAESLENDIFLVAKLKDEIAGYIIAQDLVDSINILLIATKENFKRKNVATNLILEVEKIANQKNIKTLWLEVEEGNFPAISLYEKCGFKRIYLRSNYYANGKNAIIYEKKL